MYLIIKDVIKHELYIIDYLKFYYIFKENFIVSWL